MFITPRTVIVISDDELSLFGILLEEYKYFS